jgi:hypothetical protein
LDTGKTHLPLDRIMILLSSPDFLCSHFMS